MLNKKLARELIDNALEIVITDDVTEAEVAQYLCEYMNMYGDSKEVKYEYLVCFHIKYNDVNATGNHGVVTNQPIITYPMIVQMEQSMTEEVKQKLDKPDVDVQVNIQNIQLLRTFIEKAGAEEEDVE